MTMTRREIMKAALAAVFGARVADMLPAAALAPEWVPLPLQTDGYLDLGARFVEFAVTTTSPIREFDESFQAEQTFTIEERVQPHCGGPPVVLRQSGMRVVESSVLHSEGGMLFRYRLLAPYDAQWDIAPPATGDVMRALGGEMQTIAYKRETTCVPTPGSTYLRLCSKST